MDGGPSKAAEALPLTQSRIHDVPSGSIKYQSHPPIVAELLRRDIAVPPVALAMKFLLHDHSRRPRMVAWPHGHMVAWSHGLRGEDMYL